MKKHKNSLKGFTLIELLIAIAIVAIIAVVAFVALDPQTRFRDSRDATRWTDVSAILDAAKIDQVDNRGSYVAAIEALTADSTYMIGTCGDNDSCSAIACADNAIEDDNGVDIAGLITEGYLAQVPQSPDGSETWTDSKRGYYIVKNANGSLTVGACESENTTAISVAR